MSCRDGSYPEDTIRSQADRLDRITRLLCEAARKLEGSDRSGDMSLELRNWLAKHKREDALREEQERRAQQITETRERALSKLTPKERRALGL